MDKKTESNTYLTQIRVSHKLEKEWREYASDIGTSMNSVLCIALDDWLRRVNPHRQHRSKV